MATKTKTKSKARKKPSAFDRPVDVSEELAVIIGKGPMPRTEVIKKLWKYIKKHELQDEENRRQINPDAALAKVFGSKRSVDMFKMTKLINKHLD